MNDTCSFTAKSNGTHGEQVYIWAHHNGKLNETKPTEMFKIRACTIDNLVPDLSFTEYKLQGVHPVLQFKKWKYADSECQANHGEKIKYGISDSATQRTTLKNFNEFAVCHDGNANCSYPVTNLEGLEKEQNLFICAYFDGIISRDHAKCGHMFTTYRCGIDMTTPTINFESVVISPGENFINFTKWQFNTQRCQTQHGEKLRYAISSVRNDTVAVNCIDQYATCTGVECRFKVDETCVSTHAEVNVVACFDGAINGTVCNE